MDAWLAGSGLNVDTFTVSVTDLLVEGGSFDIFAIVLHYEDPFVKFMPVFLYGLGVTGCVEATIHTGVSTTVESDPLTSPETV